MSERFNDEYAKNLYIVNQILKDYRHLPKETFEQVQADAMVGLLDAMKRYEPIGRLSFERFANKYIRYAIAQGFRQRDMLPRRIRKNAQQDIPEIVSLTDQSVLSHTDSGFESIEDRDLCEYLMNWIDERERICIYKYFYERKTHCQIADELGISRWHVRKSIEHGLSTMAKIARRMGITND